MTSLDLYLAIIAVIALCVALPGSFCFKKKKDKPDKQLKEG